MVLRLSSFNSLSALRAASTASRISLRLPSATCPTSSPLAPKIAAALRQLSTGRLKFVLNTHYHGDHTGGNKHFGQQAQIIARGSVAGESMTIAGAKGRPPL